MVYPALLPLMRTPRLLVVDWTDAPADLNWLVRFAERRNLFSARVPSHFKRSLQPDKPQMKIKYGAERMRFACRMTELGIRKHAYVIWYLLVLTAIRNILNPDNSAKVTHFCFPRQQCTLYIADYYIYSNNTKKNCRLLGNKLTRTPLHVTLYVICVSCLVVLSCLNSTQYSREAKRSSLRDLRFSKRCCWRLNSFGILRFDFG